jgi:CHAD domain-containing protein
MAYRFDLTLEPGQEACRVLVEQTARALQALLDPEGQGNVHSARKSLKRCRALLDLARRGLGGSVIAPLGNIYRDAGRLLSGARDAEVARIVLAVIVAEAGLSQYAGLLPARSRATRPEDVARAREMLLEARAELETLRWSQLGRPQIVAGLERSYDRARRDLQKTRASDEPAVVHDWRKRVKAWGYHLQLLQDVWPEVIRPFLGVADDLQEALGDHHDVSVVRDAVLAEVGVLPADLADAMAARERSMVQRAWRLGEPLLAVRAEEHASWFAALWALHR